MTVDLFRAPLDVDDPLLERLAATLSDDEHVRAAAHRGERERRRFVADHGWRRRVLAERIGCAPADVVYTLGEHGKPRLTEGGPWFSASRAAGTALYAVCETAEVGVDVEEIHADLDLVAIARRFFSPAEQAALWAVPPTGRLAAAHACWTRKEAYGKAIGAGLLFPLTEIEVWAGDDGPVRYREVVVQGVTIDDGLAAAVAVRAPDAGAVPVIRSLHG